jgi:hypothetical protein
MKKVQSRSRRSLRRAANRAERRPLKDLGPIVRDVSSKPVPWDPIKDNCQFYLVPETYAEKATVEADPLACLDERFRAQAGWRQIPGSDPSRALNVTVGMRRPPPETVTGSGMRVVAVDPGTYHGTGIRGQAAHKAFWDHQMNGRPASMPFLKSGPAIFKKLNIADGPEAVAYMMQMENVDPETGFAIQAAIWSAFNTASYPIDIETAVFVLAAFMHADPLRQHLVSNEKFIEAYGEQTQYVLQPVYDPAFILAAGRDSENPDSSSASPRRLPIEADDDLRRQIKADPTIDPEHLDTLDGLKLLLTDAEKDRVFFGGYDRKARAILNDLLRVAIQEIEVEQATVVGIVNVLIMRMMDICGDLRSDI